MGTEVKLGEGMKKEGGEQRRGKEGKWFNKETRKWVILQSQAPSFFFFLPSSTSPFSLFFSPVRLECLWKSATANALPLACTTCTQPERQTRKERPKKKKKKKITHGYFLKVWAKLLIALQVAD